MNRKNVKELYRAISKHIVAGVAFLLCAIPVQADDSEYTTKVAYDKAGFNLEVYKDNIIIYKTYIEDAMFMKIEPFDYNEDGIPDYIYSISYEDHYKIGFLISHDRAVYIHRIYNKQYSPVAMSEEYSDGYAEGADFFIEDVDDDYKDDVMVNVLLQDDKPVGVDGFTEVILYGEIEEIIHPKY